MSLKPLCLGAICYTVREDQSTDFLRSLWFLFNIRNTGVGIGRLVREPSRSALQLCLKTKHTFYLGLLEMGGRVMEMPLVGITVPVQASLQLTNPANILSSLYITSFNAL